MSSVEVSAKTLEEAKLEAAKQLGVGVADIQVEVIEEPRRLLGIIGGGEFRIKATVADAAVAAEADDATRPISADEVFAEAAPDAAPDAAPEPAPAAAPGAAPVAEEPSAPAVPTGPQAAEVSAVAERARETLQRIVDLMGLTGSVEVVAFEGRDIFLDVKGSDLGALIGRHGATLDAVQLLVSVAANNIGHTGARIIVDAEQYRARRAQALEKMALTEADKVRRTQKELVIPDLKPYERRIIHMVLKDDPDVETYSEGEGEQRQLVITPRG
jgi:spoIIIJ-associated protein